MQIRRTTTTTTTIIPLPPAANDVVSAVLASFKVLTTPLVHQATYIHNINPPPESAARGVGKPCHWSKPAEPTTLTLTHSYSHTHCLHLHTFTCTQPHLLTFSCIQFQPSVVWPGCHIMTAISLAVLSHLTESCSHASAYIITQRSAISQLKGVGYAGMGIHIDSY